MKKLYPRFALAMVLTAASILSAAEKATVTITNQSAWNLNHMFLSPIDENEWGPDQLGDQIIGTGESFQLREIPCSSYDVRLVDEDGDECIVAEVDICGGNHAWEITSEDLLECEAN